MMSKMQNNVEYYAKNSIKVLLLSFDAQTRMFLHFKIINSTKTRTKVLHKNVS